jgi:VIT1/CCC1 family predicted Fe2+/Mn2+ transporter
MADPEVALATHAREELGIDPQQLGSPVGAAGSSFLAFSVGALVPLIPWFFGGGTAAIVISLVLAAVVAVAVGVATATFTGRSWVRTVARQLAFTIIPAGVTYAIGSLVGVST